MTSGRVDETRGRGGSPVPGFLAALVAVALVANSVTEYDGGTGTTRTLGVVLPPVALALAALAVCWPARLQVVLLLLGGSLAGAARAAFYDPVRDLACTRCLPSPLAVHPDPELADLCALLAGSLVVLGLLVEAARRRSMWAVAGVVVAGGSTLAFDTPPGLQTGAVWVMVALGGVRQAQEIVRLALARRDLRRLADDLRPGRSPDEVLRARLHDPAARVEFASHVAGKGQRWLTATGRFAPEHIESDEHAEHTTLVHARGVVVARIHHSRPLVAVPAGLALRLEQSGLEAGLAHQVAELAASRSRIVERADTDRRLLERDLHDGAQQYLLALAVDLSLTDDSAAGPGAREALHDSRRDAEAALEALRTIARGVYPVLLASGGLARALQELSRRSRTRITLAGSPADDLSSTVSAALYGLVEELTASRPDAVSVSLSDDARRLEIVGGAVAAQSLNLERVAACGGIVELVPDRIVVTLP